MLGDNIKVHFAGAEAGDGHFASLEAAGIRYRLYSCYNNILGKNLGDDFSLPENHFIKTQAKTNKQLIQDSGLFTLMFGAGKGDTQTVESIEYWQLKLIEFVKQNHLDVTVVECDCQKLLGVEQAWKMREKLRKELPNKQINVFHFEDGKDGLDRLIDFSEYIAISVPEMRIVKPKTYKKDVHQLALYIKDKKPEIDIHLLGCTDFGMLKDNTFCTSADSTSWISGVKYGYFGDGKEKKHINEINKELFEKRRPEVERLLKMRGVEMTPKRVAYYTNASLCASICKQRYTQMAGNQD